MWDIRLGVPLRFNGLGVFNALKARLIVSLRPRVAPFRFANANQCVSITIHNKRRILMKKRLLALLAKLSPSNYSIHTDDTGVVTGITAYDVKVFDVAPIETLLEGHKLGWRVIVNQTATPSNKGGMLPPRVYIGKGGGGIDDVATALDSVNF